MIRANSEDAPALNVAAVVKGRERYVFLWTDACWPDVVGTLRRFIQNPDLTFSEYDRTRFLKGLKEEGYFDKLKRRPARPRR